MAKEKPEELLRFVSSLAGDDYLKVEENLGQGYVRLKISEAERRQARHDIRSIEDVVIELLRNCRDADSSKVFVSFHKQEEHLRKIAVIDDGAGVPSELHQKIFEPRVTSKLDNVVMDKYGVHGRGMALYSVKSAVDKVEVTSSLSGRGSAFKIEVDIHNLPERKDQSTFPLIRVKQGRAQIIKGPHNVPRVLVEFNLDYPGIEVYLGSPTEVLATMYTLSCPTVERRDFEEATEDPHLKLWQWVATANEAKNLSRVAERYYGLEISERNAHRVLSGEIKSISPLMETAAPSAPKGKEKKIEIGLSHTVNLIKSIQERDIRELAQTVSQTFARIGRKYFLKIEGKPQVSRVKDKIKIVLKVSSDE